MMLSDLCVTHLIKNKISHSEVHFLFFKYISSKTVTDQAVFFLNYLNGFLLNDFRDLKRRMRIPKIRFKDVPCFKCFLLNI